MGEKCRFTQSWKSYIDIVIASLAAIGTSCMVPFSLEALLQSINSTLLCTLFCLMAVIAAFRQGGVLTYLYSRLFHQSVSLRRVGAFFVFTCFFMSMAITNDVALIIFVPLAISVLIAARAEQYLIFLVTMQTIAANLGSMLTPIGNPQNLFIYSHYTMSLASFLMTTGPVTLCSAVLLLGAIYALPTTAVTIPPMAAVPMKRRDGIVFFLFFMAALASVLRFLSPWLVFVLLVPVLLARYRQVLRGVDYKLLLLFVLLFIIVGNLNRLPAIQDIALQYMAGHEFWISLGLSQIISNVPATVMLAQYTENSRDLLLGVNMGGLGTMIASMASIISFKAYTATVHSRPVAYIAFFTVSNIAFLGLLLVFYGLCL